MAKFLVVDGNSLLHRAYHAVPPLTTSGGLPTNAVYGFTNMLLRSIAEEQPDIIAVAFDKGRITFRHDTFQEYKAKRPPMPDDLRPQLPLLRDVLGALRISIHEADGYEADDLIGTLVRIAGEKGHDSLILTGDKDVLQLVGPRTQALLTRKGITDLERYDPAKTRERFGISPEQLADLKGLVGDPSDNIPGVPGIGPKTAAKLLADHGRLETVLENLSGLAPRIRQQLEDFGEQARMSKKLATIDTAVPGLGPENLQTWPGPDKPALLAVFNKLEFRSLVRRITEAPATGGVPAGKPVEAFSPDYRLLDRPDRLEAVLGDARRAGAVAVAYARGRNGIEMLGLSVETGNYLLPLQAADLEILAGVRGLLADPGVAKHMHNVKDFLRWAPDFRLLNIGFDTMVAAYLVNPLAANQQLEDVAHQYLNLVLVGHGPAAPAAAAECIRRLYPVLRADLRGYELDYLFDRVEMPLTGVLADMERVGVAVDRDQLEALSEEFGTRAHALAARICALAGEDFNLNSPRQLGYILFEKLSLPAGKKTKTGYSTDAGVLLDLAEKHEIAALLLEYRQLVKLKTTYADGLAALADPATGRLHTTLHQTVTNTGRLSSAEPNLQNIPIRMEEGRRIRRVFIPRDPARVLLTADYSQIELRILAHLSGDPALITAFRNEEDIHARTAAEVFGVPLDMVTPEMRSRAKAVNFGIIYGISDFGLARDLKVTRAEAREYIRRYFTCLPGVKEYIDAAIRSARERGYVTTALNRRRPLPELASANHTVRSFGERAAVNTPIQGTAADIIKLAMVNIHACLRERDLKTLMILQVHDELIFDAPAEEVCTVAPLVKAEMENVLPLNVPLTVDLKIGPNWYEVRQIDEVTRCLNFLR
jgi:DNA polymerase-1